MKMKVSRDQSSDSTNRFDFPAIDTDMNSNLKGTQYGWQNKARSKVKGMCTVGLLRRRLPFLTWLPSYNCNFCIYDVIAGITVGLTTIPQGIAYAAVAGLPLQVTNWFHLSQS